MRINTPAPDCENPGTAFCLRRSVVGTLASIDSQTIVLHDEHAEVVKVDRVPGTRLDLSTGTGACGRHRGECVGTGFLGATRVRLASRYPQGVNPDLLSALLGAYAQGTLEVSSNGVSRQ